MLAYLIIAIEVLDLSLWYLIDFFDEVGCGWLLSLVQQTRAHPRG